MKMVIPLLPMSTETLSANRNVKKHVGAIHISNKLSLLERKMSNVLLLNAYEDLLKKDTHQIRVKDLADMLGFESNDRSLLKKSLVNLMSTVLEWNVLDENQREKDWEASTMLSYARMKGVYCYYSYGEKLREKLYNPTMYERINLTIQKKFSSGYALALYENCLRFKNIGKTGWIQISKFRQIMGVAPKEYADFRRLNERVIKGPIKQVNSSSDILLTPEYKREKRRIIAVRFKVEDNPQMSLFGSSKMEEEGVKELAEPEHVADEQRIDREKLVKFGLSEKQIEWALAEYDQQYIGENIEVVERDYKAGKVKNLPAYVLSAMKEDYRPKKNGFEEEQEQKKKARKDEVAKRLEELKKHEELRNEFIGERIQNALNRMSTTEYDAFEKRFQQENRENMFYVKYKEKGAQHPIIQSLFRVFVRKEIENELTDEAFYEYAKGKGFTLEKGAVTVS